MAPGFRLCCARYVNVATHVVAGSLFVKKVAGSKYISCLEIR
jgi:hypothetical protein